MNVLAAFDENQRKVLSEGREYPEFRSGYAMSVEFYVQGTSGRTQVFKGLCIAKSNKGVHSSFTLRKLSVHDVYVERTFCLYWPSIKSISVERKGKVRRAKLYYIRALAGKATRIRKEYRDVK
ncbi:ribosomal protein L19 [Neorickettsia helminthoeca str. Oregon]|uniref:50S ribosomal protein L19 n=1 Tax=Neorickettsia helminthoeca str. Oregon TaxID=1286528 RepID=X5HMQ8_9RICK|nr:50S ribosomal protein L19 [Neorickettsia helminthoeca]AHX11770.1 ribosomal protein L19 [Neorickettsia helminthoeca str. Oregon]